MRIAPGGRGRALVLALLAVPLATVSPVVGAVLVAAAAGVRWFFRDPDRSIPEDGVVSPADGRISVITEEPDGRLRVGVFLNLTDVHVTRAPLSGRVESMTHDPGGHWPAFSKAADRNERLTIDCGDWSVVLIAGTVARRITGYVSVGERLTRGQRIGHIAFGSRADIVFPPGVDRSELTVAVGDRVLAGETVLISPAAIAGID